MNTIDLYYPAYQGCSLSTGLIHQYAGIRLHCGRAQTHRGGGSESFRACSFELCGFHVKVFDQDACETIVDMVRKEVTVEQMTAFVTGILMKCINKDPDILTRGFIQTQQEAYEQGVSDGRKQKIEELKKWMSQ